MKRLLALILVGCSSPAVGQAVAEEVSDAGTPRRDYVQDGDASPGRVSDDADGAWADSGDVDTDSGDVVDAVAPVPVADSAPPEVDAYVPPPPPPPADAAPPEVDAYVPPPPPPPAVITCQLGYPYYTTYTVTCSGAGLSTKTVSPATNLRITWTWFGFSGQDCPSACEPHGACWADNGPGTIGTAGKCL